MLSSERKEHCMHTPLFVGVDVHRKDNHFHCLDPTGQTVATFKQRNNRPGTQRAISQPSPLYTTVHSTEFALPPSPPIGIGCRFFSVLPATRPSTSAQLN